MRIATDVQQPDDHPQDSIAAFAADLRDLRRAAGNPTLAALSARVGISKSVISVALSGRELPTERTVVELVEELGGEQREWRRRREALMAPKGDAAPDPAALAEPVPESALRRRRFTLLQLALVAALSIVVSVGVTSAVWSTAAAETTLAAGTPENADGPYFQPANGVDPMRTKCKDDRVIAVDEARFEGQVHVQLLYSNNCFASWGRVTRYDGASNGNSVSMRIWIEKDPNGKRTQERTGKNAQSVYTPMIIEPDPDVRICGQATITAEGKTVELGPPICG
jgi:transcriptional regulator with XRE-family HTH domain